MVDSVNKNLDLREGEKIVFHSQKMGIFPIWRVFFPVIWLGMFLYLLLGLIVTYAIKDFFFFYIILLVLIMLSILLTLLFDLVLSNSNASLYITSRRVVFVHSKGFLRFKRKNKEISLQNISYIQIWSELFEFAKRRIDGKDKYVGSEEKYLYWTFKRYYSISFNLKDAPNSEITQKILNALSESISFVKHPNLEGILLFNALNS